MVFVNPAKKKEWRKKSGPVLPERDVIVKNLDTVALRGNCVDFCPVLVLPCAGKRHGLPHVERLLHRGILNNSITPGNMDLNLGDQVETLAPAESQDNLRVDRFPVAVYLNINVPY